MTRSSSVRRMRCLQPSASSPKALAASARFSAWSLRIWSSTVSLTVKRVTCTSRRWPMRWQRSIACSSTVGFHHTSRRRTWLAQTRLTPRPAALSDMSITVTLGSSSNSMSALSRAASDMAPSSRRNWNPSFLSGPSRRSSMDVHCEKMIDFSTKPSAPSRSPAAVTTGASFGSAAASAASELRILPRIDSPRSRSFPVRASSSTPGTLLSRARRAAAASALLAPPAAPLPPFLPAVGSIPPHRSRRSRR
mmetsp:Transcript_2208/g.8015  ORF Transcript_2208/g.8015 Transcript_2208/m.8015 type:complete len:250 (-) Transcript_2208:253-1002(-)